MKSLCIIGTDTDVGKTIVTAGLFNCLKNSGLKTEVQKWISTGDTSSGLSDDLKFVYNTGMLTANQKLTTANSKIKFNSADFLNNNPYSFKFPASPHLSARLENRQISISRIIESYNYFSDKCDFLLVEGAGGLLTPVNEKYNFDYLIKKLNMPVILVIKNQLGAINQTLLTYNYLNQKKIKLAGIVFNNFFNDKKIIQNENMIYLITKIQPACALAIKNIKTKKELVEVFSEFTEQLD